MDARNSAELIRELATMQERLNRAWSSLYDGDERASGGRRSWMPLVDIYQSDSREIVLKAELAGVRREDIQLTVDNDALTIQGERRRDDGVPDESYHRTERAYGSFSRTFTLPKTVDASAVRAEYRDGVLTVHLPLREEAHARQIDVAGVD